MVWADLATPDLAAAEKFYGGLFGWTFQPVRAGDVNYAVAMLEGRPIGGLVEEGDPGGPAPQSAWLTFLAASDVDSAKKVAVSHGAKVLSDIKSYPMRGRQIVLSDPEGAAFALLASSTGDTPDYLPAHRRLDLELTARQGCGRGSGLLPKFAGLRCIRSAERRWAGAFNLVDR